MSMRERTAKAANTILIAIFITFIAGMMLINRKALSDIVSKTDISYDTFQTTATSIDSQWKTNLKYRNELIDLYGLSMRLMGRSLIGNFEFIKDESDIIQLVSPRQDMTGFLESMRGLKAAADRTGTPFLYMTVPNRADNLSVQGSDGVYVVSDLNWLMGHELAREGIDCVFFDELAEADPDGPDHADFFFKTDIHMTTRGEFWIAKTLAEYLSEHYGVTLYDAERIFDLDNYDVVAYPFVGNMARSVGRYYVGEDTFEIYRPRFETELQLVNPTNSLTRQGAFADVALNGYESRQNIDVYTYWITDFGQYPVPFYEYTNLMAPDDAPTILLVTDSMFMRGLSYLSLGCRKLTVLDPRTFNGEPYVAEKLAEENYDAILTLGGGAGYFISPFVSE